MQNKLPKVCYNSARNISLIEEIFYCQFKQKQKAFCQGSHKHGCDRISPGSVKEYDSMICPYCSKEMEKGYIDQAELLHPLEWYSAKREAGVFAKRKNTVRLTCGGNVAAYRCADCGKILIDESTLKA